MPITPVLKSPASSIPLAIAALFCLVQIVAAFPGELVFDSQQQLDQALSRHYGDWHPPIMALLWTHLIQLSGNRGALLVVHQVLHWLGFGLIADGSHRAGMKKRAWCILLAGLFPFFVIFDKIVVKDVGMASAFVAALGLTLWYLLQDRKPSWWAWTLAAVCLLYGGLIRTNAVFALGPIVYLCLTRGRQFNLVTAMSCSIALTLIAVPVSSWINHRLIGARLQDPMQSLQIFDLMGIAARSGDNRVWGDHAPPLSDIQSCYSSYWWDNFSPWGNCAWLRAQVGASPDIDTVDEMQIRRRGQLWRQAIVAHPLQYAIHRLAHFNSSLYFLVPSLHFRYAGATWVPSAYTAHDIRMDYIKRNFLFWPMLWLAIGLSGIFLVVPRERPVPVAVAKSLMLSGVLYSVGYLPVGVSSEIRYHYWPVMAILLGVILAANQYPLLFRERPWRGRIAAALVVAVLLGGYAARLADVTLF